MLLQLRSSLVVIIEHFHYHRHHAISYQPHHIIVCRVTTTSSSATQNQQGMVTVITGSHRIAHNTATRTLPRLRRINVTHTTPGIKVPHNAAHNVPSHTVQPLNNTVRRHHCTFTDITAEEATTAHGNARVKIRHNTVTGHKAFASRLSTTKAYRSDTDVHGHTRHHRNRLLRFTGASITTTTVQNAQGSENSHRY